MIQYQIHFKDFDTSESVYNDIVDKIEKIETFSDAVTSCHVTVSHPHHHEKNANYHVKIHAHLPGKEIVIDREPARDRSHSDVYVAIRDAFDSLYRSLEETMRKRREHRNYKIGDQSGDNL